METPKVFISYSSADRQDAFRLLKIVEAAGADAWMDFFDIKPANLLDQQLTSNLDAADVACILLTPSAVASKWVAYEIQHAKQRTPSGVRVLPIIVRPCQIPRDLEEVVAVDASDGLDDEAVRIRIARAITGADPTGTDGTLLDAAERSLLARREVESDVEKRLPHLTETLDRVRETPVPEIKIQVDQNTFPEETGLVVELQLVLDPLWNAPMRWFFARYREDETWPEWLAFEEPPYTEFYLRRRPPIDCRFRWYDRYRGLQSSIDGTDDRSMLASFSQQFEGDEWQPAGTGPQIPKTFEIPGIRTLADDGSQFELYIHRDGQTVKTDDPETTEIDIRVTAYFRDQQPTWVTLYSTRHEPQDRMVLNAPAILGVTSPIERQALTGLYRPTEKLNTAGWDDLVQAVLDEKPVESAEVRRAAQLAVSRAGLYAFRTNFADAARLDLGATNLLGPLVMDGFPTQADGILLYQACTHLLECFTRSSVWTEARKAADAPVLVARRLAGFYPDEPDYRRMTGAGLIALAQVELEVDDPNGAAEHLIEGVDTWLALAEERPTPIRLADARKAYAAAISSAEKKGIADRLPLERWKDTLDPQLQIAGGVRDQIRTESTGPLWTVPASPDGWSTFVFESPGLRYRIPVPQRWSAEPAVSATPREIWHVFRGTNPATLLGVRFMDKADAHGDMRNWVGATLSFTGFPIMELSGDGQPTLMDWRYEGRFDAVAQRLSLDDAHCWSGLARVGGDGTSLRRLYVAGYRRSNFAWLISLALETAVLPGMPEEALYSNDHVRAGATFGYVQLG